MKTSTMAWLVGGAAAVAGVAFLALRVDTNTGSMVRVPASAMQSGGMTLDAVAVATGGRPLGSMPLDVQIVQEVSPGVLLGDTRLPGDAQLTAVTFRRSDVAGASAAARLA